MGFIQRAKERVEANERIIQNLQQFQGLTSKSKYKEILLCQIKHSSTKRGKKLFAKFATDILGWLDIFHRSEGGTMASKVNGLTEKHSKYNMKQSKKYKLNKEDGIKIAKGAGIAIGGSLVTYLISIIGDVDFGTYTPIIVAIASVLLNAARKYFASK